MTEVYRGSAGELCSLREDINKTDDEKAKNVIVQGYFTDFIETKLVDTDNINIIKNKNGKDIGELLVRGPCCINRYFRSNINKSFIKDNKGNIWFKTGDIVCINNKDQMNIIDRSKDLIKSGGEWISTIDMQHYLCKLNQIKVACVIGWNHSKWDERPVAILQLEDGCKDNISKERIVEYMKNKYAKWQIPDDFLFWKEIPLTGTGKISKKDVRRILKTQNYQLPTDKNISKL